MSYWQRICCAVDFSDVSRLALDQAAFLARTFGSTLTVLHVHEEPAPGGDVTPSQARRQAEDTLESWRAQAEFLADRPARSAMLEGSPPREIVRYAREGAFDTIVLGSCGRSGLKQLVLGSVAEYVVRTAHCPVLAVRRVPPS